MGSPGCLVAGSPGGRVTESNLIVLQLSYGCMIWGRQVAGSPSCRVPESHIKAK